MWTGFECDVRVRSYVFGSDKALGEGRALLTFYCPYTCIVVCEHVGDGCVVELYACEEHIRGMACFSGDG